MKPLHELSLTEASAGIARRRFSPVEYLDALHTRAEDVGGKVHIDSGPAKGTTIVLEWDRK